MNLLYRLERKANDLMDRHLYLTSGLIFCFVALISDLAIVCLVYWSHGELATSPFYYIVAKCSAIGTVLLIGYLFWVEQIWNKWRSKAIIIKLMIAAFLCILLYYLIFNF